MTPIALTWDLRTRADIERTWALLADTDRFNRALGLGFQFETHRDLATGAVRRTGRVTRLGMTHTWDEHPFEIDAPHRLRSTRDFHAGPALRLTAELTLSEETDGTRIRYTTAITPRNTLGIALVWFDMHTNTRPGLDRVLRNAVLLLDGKPASYDPPPPALSSDARSRLGAGLGAIPEAFRDPLRRLVEEAPLADQARVRPLEFAARAGLSDDDMLDAIPIAIQHGLVEARAEVMCPYCRGPARKEGDRQHCDGCGVAWDAAFPSSAELVLRPHPSIRAVDMPIDCLLSPMRTPELIVQVPIRAGGGATVSDVVLEANLEPGTYRLRIGPHTAAVDVAAHGPRTVKVEATAGGMKPWQLRLGRGAVRIEVRSRLDLPGDVRLERRYRPERSLSVADLLYRSPALAELVFEPGIAADARRRAIVAVDIALLGSGGRYAVRAALSTAEVMVEGVDELLAAFSEDRAALEAVDRLRTRADLSCSIAAGTVIRRGDRLAGPPVERARRRLREIGHGHTFADYDAPLLSAAIALGWPADGLVEHTVREIPLPEPPARIGARFDVHGRVLIPTGALYPGVDTVSGAPIVLKLPFAGGSPEAARRLLAEADHLLKLKHPAYPKVIDVGVTEDDWPFVALAPIHDPLLSDRLHESIYAGKVCAMGIGLLRALIPLHDDGIAHLGLCPQIVTVRDEDDARGPVGIVDLGTVSRIGEPQLSLRDLTHAAPEQRADGPVDARSDLWAVGAILYQSLCGAWPEASPQTGRPDPLGPRCRQPVAKALIDVIMQAIDPDPEARFTNVRAMLSPLEALGVRFYAMPVAGTIGDTQVPHGSRSTIVADLDAGSQ